MAKQKLDFGKFTYNSAGVCENPDVVLAYSSKKIIYKLEVAQCHAG